MAADDLSSELARIAVMDTDSLRSLWLRSTGKSPSRQLSGDLLRRMVMHYVQERCLGGLDRKLATMLDRLADGDGAVPARLRLGSVLVREHGGIVHQVMVVENGFAWQGRILPSLSTVAQAITGTKWNGHRFFGLRKTELAEVDGSAPGLSKPDRSKVDLGEERLGRTELVTSRREQAGRAQLAEATP